VDSELTRVQEPVPWLSPKAQPCIFLPTRRQTLVYAPSSATSIKKL